MGESSELVVLLLYTLASGDNPGDERTELLPLLATLPDLDFRTAPTPLNPIPFMVL